LWSERRFQALVLFFGRVEVLLDYRPALRQRTGAGEYVHELAAAWLRHARLEDSLHLFTSSWKDRLSPDVARDLAGARVIDRRLPVRVLNHLWHRYRWPPVETIAGRSFDIVHAAHPLLIPSRSAAQLVTIHDLHFLDHPEQTRAEIRRDYASLAPRSAQAADGIVTASRYAAGEIERRLGVHGDAIAVCRPGLPAWIRGAVVPPATSDGYVLFVGTLEPRKNLTALLDAYARLGASGRPLPRLRIAGAAGTGLDALRVRLQEPVFGGRVEYVGYVPDNERLQLYAGARVLAMPSVEEGFGLPALEAMALGVPVLASARGALPEVIGDAGVLVEPTGDALADGLRRLLDEPGLAATCRDRGLTRAAGFSWDAAAGDLRTAYERARARRAERDARRH
jgi:glycosyltransferase involved in cell wall biosynthesis